MQGFRRDSVGDVLGGHQPVSNRSHDGDCKIGVRWAAGGPSPAGSHALVVCNGVPHPAGHRAAPAAFRGKFTLAFRFGGALDDISNDAAKHLQC
jgi:hypothetical protein